MKACCAPQKRQTSGTRRALWTFAILLAALALPLAAAALASHDAPAAAPTGAPSR